LLKIEDFKISRFQIVLSFTDVIAGLTRNLICSKMLLFNKLYYSYFIKY